MGYEQQNSNTAYSSQSQWWEEDDPHMAMVSALKSLDDENGHRRELNKHHLRLYSNRLALGLDGADWSLFDQGDKLKLNIVKSVVNTATATIATNRTRPMYLTKRGSREQRKRGKDLGRFSLGQFYANRFYRKGNLVFRDGGIFGDGFLKVVPGKFGTIDMKRIISDDIIVDDMETRDGEPRSMMEHRLVDRKTLIARFPDKKWEIDQADFLRDQLAINRNRIADPVSVLFGYRLPNEPGKPGRKSIVCSTCTLDDDKEWLRDKKWPSELRFPYSHFCYDPPVLGYHGSGLAEDLNPIQIEINYILQKIQRLMTLATSQVWVEQGSKVNVSSINNEDWSVNTYRGRPPIFMAVQAVSQEYFLHLDRLWARGFESIGQSQMVATGQKPSGIEAAKALRTLRDVTSRRFLHVQQEWDEWMLDSSELMLDAARELSKTDKGYRVLAKYRDGIEEIDFKDVDLERDKYLMQVHPVSLLPDEPAGQMQTLKEFGEIDPVIRDNLMEHMQYPDLEEAVQRALAPRRHVELIVEEILDKGDEGYEPPDGYMRLDMAIPYVRAEISKARLEGAEPKNIELLQEWLLNASSIVDKMRMEAAAMQGQVPGGPAAPGPQEPPAGPALAPPSSPQSGPMPPV